jgi:hypothetical protein
MGRSQNEEKNSISYIELNNNENFSINDKLDTLNTDFEYNTDEGPSHYKITNLKNVEIECKIELAQSGKVIKFKSKLITLTLSFIFLLFKLIFENSMTIIGSILYLITLKSCNYSQDECVFLLQNEYLLFIAGTIIFLSALFYFINFILVLNKKIRSYSILVEFLVIFYICIIYDTNTDFISHGGYNRLILLAIELFFFTIFSIYKVFIFVFKKNKLLSIIGFISVIITIYFSFKYSFQSSCNGWNEGFKKSRIDQQTPCKLHKPKICYEKLLNNVFDVSFYLGDTCEKIQNNKKDIILRYNKLLSRTVKRIGYPRVESWDFTWKSIYSNYKSQVVENLIDMDDNTVSEEEKKNVEAIIDFQGKEPEVQIIVKRQDELAKKREEIFKSNYKGGVMSEGGLPFKNIFFVFIDSVSRNHFKRKLPKFYSWIENFYESESDPDIKYESFQFLKYHATATWTNGNMMPLFFGVPWDESCCGIYSLNWFKQKGYVTGSILNQCSREFVDLHANAMTQKLTWTNYDHEFSSLFCDPNFSPPDNPFPIMNGPYGVRKKCLYSKPTLDYALNYTSQFAELYKDQPKFYRIGNINGHEGTGEVIKYDDDTLVEFMKDFERNGHMQDTLTIIFSDHGYAMPGFHTIFKSEDHKKEATLPVLYFIIPKNHKEFSKLKLSLKSFENVFITPYDLHNTLISTLNDPRIPTNNLGRDILTGRFQKYNAGTCKYFKIIEEWCKCEIYE